jgi:hypothetical protein
MFLTQLKIMAAVFAVIFVLAAVAGFVLQDGLAEKTPTPGTHKPPAPEPQISQTPEPQISQTPEPQISQTPEPQISQTPEPQISQTPEPPWAKPEWLTQMEAIHQLIKPGRGEWKFMEVPWEATIYEARKKAAEQGKPLFIWCMAGEPLGQC